MYTIERRIYLGAISKHPSIAFRHDNNAYKDSLFGVYTPSDMIYHHHIIAKNVPDFILYYKSPG